MDFIRETDEVFRSRGPITRLTGDDIAFLKKQAKLNPRRRVRLCAHPDSEDRLHEMIIVHMRNTYVPPHRHIGKSESFHMIEGLLSVFIFDESGTVCDVIPMGGEESGRVVFYRLNAGLYHSILLESEFVVFHEVTNGPFRQADTDIAPWAPADDDFISYSEFTTNLLKALKKTKWCTKHYN